jgi:hypothetical protein
MSRVSYFQRFSQRENHATNNTLLIFRHFYQTSPFKLQRVLTSLVDTELSIGLSFDQQVRGDVSVPDALISQKPLSLFIETKRGDELNAIQIERHIKSIVGNGGIPNPGQVILLGVTREPIGAAQLEQMRASAERRGVLFAAVSFSQIVEALRAQCADFESNLLEIVQDFEEFLAEEGLLEGRNQRLAVFPCGQSFAENERFNLYYEGISRPCKRNNRFIGIYTRKQVSLIGMVEAIAICDYQEGHVTADVEQGTFTDEHRARVKTAMEETPYYDLKSNPLRFYLVDSFVATCLRKESPGGIMGMRYLDLPEIAGEAFDGRKAYTSEEIAELLSGRTFK